MAITVTTPHAPVEGQHDQPLSDRVATLTDRYPVPRKRALVLLQMSAEERLEIYRSGGMTLDDCCMWASYFAHEVPLIDGEFEFHMLFTPEVCERDEASR